MRRRKVVRQSLGLMIHRVVLQHWNTQGYPCLIMVGCCLILNMPACPDSLNALYSLHGLSKQPACADGHQAEGPGARTADVIP
jgi:hypothetical protein